MRKCKYSKCENPLDSNKRKEYCSKRCWRLNNRVIKTKKCSRKSCENTFKVYNGAKQYCSLECRKKGTEKSEEQQATPPIRNQYNHDYNFIFSNRLQDWIYSPKRTYEDRRKKKRLKIRESG